MTAAQLGGAGLGFAAAITSAKPKRLLCRVRPASAMTTSLLKRRPTRLTLFGAVSHLAAGPLESLNASIFAMIFASVASVQYRDTPTTATVFSSTMMSGSRLSDQRPQCLRPPHEDLAMATVRFDPPVSIELGKNGKILNVGSVREASACLLSSRWPNVAGRAFEQALVDLLDAKEGRKSAKEARDSFVDAAKEAHILKRA
jgi:hypothetical protein